MGTYLVSVPENEGEKIIEISAKHKCPAVEVGTVKDELEISIGGKIFVDKEKMRELIRQFPYRKANI